MNKVTLALSGGMDSTTLLGFFLHNYPYIKIHCCIFHYGSKHNIYENIAAHNIFEYYQEKTNRLTLSEIDLTNIFSLSKSNLLKHGESIPEGHYASENMKKTVVPGRNLIFIAVMASIAESIDSDCIAYGAHSGDHFIYPDCRSNFVDSARNTVYLSTDKKVTLIAPFMGLNKTKILKCSKDFSIPVPYYLTRTCYKDQPIACGKCGSCNERLEAFNAVNMTDPIEYRR